MTGSQPDLTSDILLATGYYYAVGKEDIENGNLLTGDYYAVIDVENTANAGECGGVWRTVVISKASDGYAPAVRKEMKNGKLYIITEDNQMYDAQGQKVEQ